MQLSDVKLTLQVLDCTSITVKTIRMNDTTDLHYLTDPEPKDVGQDQPNVAGWVRSLRLKAGLGLEEAAKATGMSVPEIGCYESGCWSINCGQILRLVEAYKVSTYEFAAFMSSGKFDEVIVEAKILSLKPEGFQES
jgi:hypothetical protein